MSLLGQIALFVLGRAFDLLEKRIGPAPAPNHDGVTDAQIDDLIRKAKDLKPQ